MTYMQTNKYNNAKVIGRIVVGGNIIPIYDLHSNGHFFVVNNIAGDNERGLS